MIVWQPLHSLAAHRHSARSRNERNAVILRAVAESMPRHQTIQPGTGPCDFAQGDSHFAQGDSHYQCTTMR